MKVSLRIFLFIVFLLQSIALPLISAELQLQKIHTHQQSTKSIKQIYSIVEEEENNDIVHAVFIVPNNIVLLILFSETYVCTSFVNESIGFSPPPFSIFKQFQNFRI